MLGRLAKLRNLLRMRLRGVNFVYLDIGSAGGIPEPYIRASRLGLAKLLLVDPQEDWRKAPGNEYAGCDMHSIPFALGATSERRKLYVTAAPGCSSLLPPNESTLSRFPVRDWFEVARTTELRVKPFLELAAEMDLPNPDIAKVDVQGAELQVLDGFGSLLDSVACIDLEVVMEPLYCGQPELQAVYRYLSSRGFALRDLKPQGPFEGEAIEFNSFWSRRKLTDRQQAIESFWRCVHGVCSGEYFAAVDPAARSGVRFNEITEQCSMSPETPR